MEPLSGDESHQFQKWKAIVASFQLLVSYMKNSTERMLIVAGLSAVYSLYWPVNALTASASAYDLTLPIDRMTPLIPEWIYIYALFFVTSYLPVLVVRDRQLFRRIALAALGFELVSLATFLCFPVRYVLRPDVLPEIDSLATWGMHFMYWLDAPVNCFPSLHVGAAFFAAVACWKADRGLSLASGLLALLIGASTMLVKQHYLADFASAVALVGVLYAVVIAPLDLRDRPVGELRHDRRFLLIIPAVYGLLIGAFATLYALDWMPWLE
jgi:type IV secretory pathway TrbD component